MGGRLRREAGEGGWGERLGREAGEEGWGGRLGREGEEGGWGGRLGREGEEGEVLTCSQSKGTIVVFQLGDPPHQEFWRLQYPVCVCIYPCVYHCDAQYQ